MASGQFKPGPDARRTGGMQKGETRNPGGYSKERRERDAVFREYICAKTNDCKDLVDRMIQISKQSDDLASANKAIGMLLDRGIGKVREHIELEGNAVDAAQVALVIAARMTPHERAQKLAELDADSEPDAEPDAADEG